MNVRQTEAIRSRRYVVRFVDASSRRIGTCAFATDLRAVWFMERTARQGFKILSCRAPSIS